MMPIGGGGGPAWEAACSSGAARSRAEAKQPQQTLSVLPRPSLGPPSTNSQRLPPPLPQKKQTFRCKFDKCKIQFFLLNAWCGRNWEEEKRPPVSCCGSDLALACYLLLLLHTETSCFFVQLPITLQGNCPLPSLLLLAHRYPPTICTRVSLSLSFLQLDPPEFGLSALVRGVRLFRQLA